MIDTIIFDIGQVLVHFRWKEYIKELGFEGETADRLGQATVLSKWWQKVDLGMAKEEYEAGMKKDHPELKNEIERFFSHTSQIVKPFSYSEGLLKGLKENGYRIYLLSNYGDYFYHEASPKFTFRKYIDGELISYEIHEIKPNPAIYHTLFERFQINPKNAVFLDDNADNIRGAKAVGLNGILFEGMDQAARELKAYGVNLQGICLDKK